MIYGARRPSKWIDKSPPFPNPSRDRDYSEFYFNLTTHHLCGVKLRAGFKSAKAFRFRKTSNVIVSMDQVWETGPFKKRAGIQANDAQLKGLNDGTPGDKGRRSQPFLLTVKQRKSGIVFVNKCGFRKEDQKRNSLPERRRGNRPMSSILSTYINGLTIMNKPNSR